MKTFYSKILIVLITTFSTNSINAQYQSLFGSVNTSWNMFFTNTSELRTDSLYTVSDIVINGMIYKEIFYQTISETPHIPLSTVGYLREDSAQGKAWFFSNQDTTERLIMDLNLNLGDTFYVSGIWNPNPGYYPVDSIWVDAGRRDELFM